MSLSPKNVIIDKKRIFSEKKGPASFSNGPRDVVCYVCGQRFGTHSIGIHVPNCIKKWENIEGKKQRSERRPVPQKPQNYDAMIKGLANGNYKILKKYNKEADNLYNTFALVACGCGRTFFEE